MGSSNNDIDFPDFGLRVLSAILHFVGTAILSSCLSRRLALEELHTLRGWRNLTAARLAVILIFADSLAFLMITGILIHGVGLERSNASCSLAIFCCIGLYTSSKVFIYIFLSERVWLVWSNRSDKNSGGPGVVEYPGESPHRNTMLPHSLVVLAKRLRTPLYALCFISVALYATCIILMLLYRIADRREKDGHCVIGLERQASIPLLTYDV